MVPTGLFSPYDLGPYRLRDRFVMAPMIRPRCGRNDVPGDMVAGYYAQRASTGLIVTEDTFPDLAARTWLGQSGVGTTGQAAGWREVADAVYARSGIIVMQIVHTGRLSHLTINGTDRAVSVSDTTVPGYTHNLSGRVDHVPAEPLIGPEIERIIESWARATHNAIDAGMDGIQIHGADGYLVHQFLAFNANTCDDEWGDDPHQRTRLTVEMTRAVATEIDEQRTSIRLSPEHNIWGIEKTDPIDVKATYQRLVREVALLGLSFVNILHTAPDSGLAQGIRRTVDAPLAANRGLEATVDREEAAGLIADGVVEAAGVDRPALANPDLVERWRTGALGNTLVQETVYGDRASGYTNYPTLQDREAPRWSWLSRLAILLPEAG